VRFFVGAIPFVAAAMLAPFLLMFRATEDDVRRSKE
jgi:hypothetical protein